MIENLEAAGDGKIAPMPFQHLKKEPLGALGHDIKQEKPQLKDEPENPAGRDAQKAHGKEAEHFLDGKTLAKIGLSPKKS